MDPFFFLPPTDRHDPAYGGPWPRWRPRQRAHTWRHDKKRQVVWPKDKKQKGARSWSRWKDVLTGKGPDMWIAGRDCFGPHRPLWSGWKSPYGRPRIWDNSGYRYRKDDTYEFIPWAKRPSWQKYDFRARKYQRPQPGTWSDVKWSDDKSGNGNPPFALYRRDRNGYEFVEPEFDGGWFNAGMAPNPFAYKHYSPVWDWHRDRLPWPVDQRYWFDD